MKEINLKQPYRLLDVRDLEGNSNGREQGYVPGAGRLHRGEDRFGRCS